MLAEAVLIYTIAYQISSKLAPIFDKEDGQNELHEKGVHTAKQMLAAKGAATNINTTKDLRCLELQMDHTDPLGVIIGPVLKLTTEEIQWASEVERWDCEEVVAILRFIALTQPLRT